MLRNQCKVVLDGGQTGTGQPQGLELAVTREQNPKMATESHGEWLVEDGDPVSPGQPLLRLYPAQDSSGVDA